MNDRLPRKLAAILYADVADYSRLTGEDEDATHLVLRSYLDFISSAIQNHSGRVVHYAGDAVLADFSTVLDALHCATAIQGELRRRNEQVPEDRKLQFRIGVNLGDVIVDQQEIYGDGVNVAARLESLAEPGGICISEAVRTAIGNKLPLEYDDMGEQRVKNIERSVHVYRPRLKPGGELPVATQRLPPGSPHKVNRIKWRNSTVVTAVILILIAAVVIGLRPWDRAEQPSSIGAIDSRATGETSAPDLGAASVPPANFLSENGIRAALIGNTISFRSPKDGVNRLIYFAVDGSVTVKVGNNPELVTIHNWYFKSGDVFCRTIGKDKRTHCTRVTSGDSVDTLNFINAKRGIFYTASVLRGRQLPG
jgi:class 3 adenylate cyclase